MKDFETIISILEDNGSMTISSICAEVNRRLSSDLENLLLPVHIQSIINRKKDLFQIQEGEISIAPDKKPFFLVATLEVEQGICYQVNVNFTKKRFTYFEWRNLPRQEGKNSFLPKNPGDFNEFKSEIFNMKIWEWQPLYATSEGIHLGDTNWTVKLVTSEKIYYSEGTDCYPAEWRRFCRAIEKLTGANFAAKTKKD
ncbi:hypothetical protein ACQYAD_10795 [Neobacillus sp. SM06]|uniref:hypothetical protein n=1 Tax=Neobacillus sp. SM06 TaxID=3422492 RepID=UPI003D2AC6DD